MTETFVAPRERVEGLIAKHQARIKVLDEVIGYFHQCLDEPERERIGLEQQIASLMAYGHKHYGDIP